MLINHAHKTNNSNSVRKFRGFQANVPKRRKQKKPINTNSNPQFFSGTRTRIAEFVHLKRQTVVPITCDVIK
jgi:hypothetical protein